jgi:hypothetical protein
MVVEGNTMVRMTIELLMVVACASLVAPMLLVTLLNDFLLHSCCVVVSGEPIPLQLGQRVFEEKLNLHSTSGVNKQVP